MKKNPDISVIIVNFNTAGLTRACLAKVFASELGTYQMETYLVDNGSTEGSVGDFHTMFPKLNVIESKDNVGFAAGNNLGIRRSTGRYVLLLNSDTEVSANALSDMIRFMDGHPDCGAATAKLMLPDGSMDPACHRGIPSPWVAFTYVTKLEKLFPKSKAFGEYHQGYKDFSKAHEVDCISGAFFMVRREVVDRVGMLDEEFFMYGEDIDWSYRIRKAGWKIYFNPETAVLHKKKQSGRAHESKRRKIQSELYFHRYNWLFFKKHFEKSSGAFLSLFVNLFYTIRILMLKKTGI